MENDGCILIIGSCNNKEDRVLYDDLARLSGVAAESKIFTALDFENFSPHERMMKTLCLTQQAGMVISPLDNFDKEQEIAILMSINNKIPLLLIEKTKNDDDMKYKTLPIENPELIIYSGNVMEVGNSVIEFVRHHARIQKGSRK